GVEVDWKAVIGSGRRMVDLPTYAFQRTRYWLESEPVAAAEPVADSDDARFWHVVEAVRGEDIGALADSLAVEPASLAEVLPALSEWRRREAARADLDSWRHSVSWQPLATRTTSTTPGLSGCWLLVADEYDQAMAPAVADAIRRAGAEAVTVRVDPARADREAVAAALRAASAGGDLAGIVSLVGTDDRPDAHRPGLTAGFAATVVLMQALADLGTAAPLWCVSTSAVSVGTFEPLDHPLQAQLWGLGIVAGLDTPANWGGLVDLPSDADDAVLDRFCAVLARGDGEDQVAVRRSGVFGRRLVRARAGDGVSDRSWRPRGTVLITGGTGALGGHVARWLAANGATRLVLTSRRGDQAPGTAELLAELADLGAHATAVACDLADRDAVAALLVQARADGPLTAVVHTAGVSGEPAPLVDTGLDDLAATLAAKVSGARHLDELLADEHLDAFVLFSSAAGVWGNAGQSAYAAGNAYLMALAQYRRDHGQPATCVAWGAWDGGGMVDAAEGARLARNGVLPMAPEQAIACLQQAMDADDTSLVVARVDWPRFAELYTLSRPRPLLDALPQARPARAGELDAADAVTDDVTVGLAARLLAMGEDERQRELLRLVRERAAGTLGHPTPDAVRASRPFRELGFDSLTAVDLRNQLNAVTGLRIPVTAVFDHPTPAALARHLNSAMAPAASGSAMPGSARLDMLPLAAVEQLESSLAIVDGDEGVRRQVADRLRELLGRWERTDEGLEGISDDDMFDLIDRELGES
ncbi:SDR family NAD(P)-dependent oxidoreductase, partial [Streptacidiphilus sp. EB129]|uniref:SDR family NAD(P)-dependent oxidoreductase n=1 Tax=Streptacidiphilus sp. EB129 TaxID=3156262 RepID=UPI003519384D